MTTTAVQEHKKKALGRGLESLIPAARGQQHAVEPRIAPATESLAPGEAVVEIPLGEIEPSPYQPRRRKQPEPLQELAASIRASGVMQPIIVRRIGAGIERHAPGNGEAKAAEAGHAPSILYQLIAGERRWLASEIAGRKTIPAIVRAASNEQAMELALVENLQREDLGPIEMAHAFDRLSRDFGLTQEQISQRTGKDRATIGNYIRLLKLGPSVQQALEEGGLTFGHAKALLALESREAIALVAADVMANGYSVRQTEEIVKRMIRESEQPGQEDTTKPPRPVDPNVRAAERQLEENLRLRVKIIDRHGKGKVVIEYATLEDFDHLVQVLSK